MYIVNDGTGDKFSGNYSFRINKCGKQYKNKWKTGKVKGFPRLRKNIWYLIEKCLKNGFSNRKGT